MLLKENTSFFKTQITLKNFKNLFKQDYWRQFCIARSSFMLQNILLYLGDTDGIPLQSTPKARFGTTKLCLGPSTPTGYEPGHAWNAAKFASRSSGWKASHNNGQQHWDKLRSSYMF